MKCEIIKDLFPSYIDGLTSADSNEEIEAHLKTCQQCKEVLTAMETAVPVQNVEFNKKQIKPFKKLNKRVLRAVLITLAACTLALGLYSYFFVVGWKADSKDINISYSYSDTVLTIDFELTNGKALTAWSDRGNPQIMANFGFRECFVSILDDMSNRFSYGIHYADQDGNITKTFSDDDLILLQFSDKTQTLNLKEIAEELGLQ